ncbi:MAG: ComF family protein [Acidobacteriota bacterium]
MRKQKATHQPPSPAPLRWGRRLLATVLPSPCLACGDPQGERRWGLCRDCRKQLRPARFHCRGCLRALSVAHPPPTYLCGTCRRSPPPFDRLWARWSYEDPLPEALKAFKYGRLDYLGEELGEELGRWLGERLEFELESEIEREESSKELSAKVYDLVIPIPLHWRRRLRRGFNQAERVARPVARHLGARFSPSLRRRRATGHQSRLGRRQRARNPRSAFASRNPQQIAGKRILLVDDIATTGATLRAAARCLRQAEAAHIEAAVIATTPSSSPGHGPPRNSQP